MDAGVVSDPKSNDFGENSQNIRKAVRKNVNQNIGGINHRKEIAAKNRNKIIYC